MPGGREISGADVLAALRAARDRGVDAGALVGAVRSDDVFADYDELLAACPPARLGLSPGAHAAVLAPLFGEFE